MALFESSSHPEHTHARAVEALLVMDKIIQTLSLPMMDLDDPEVCTYSPRSVPSVFYGSGYNPPQQCGCVRLASTHASPSGPPTRYGYSFSYNPPWDESAPLEELRREECRRICWSALNLIANYTAQCAAFHEDAEKMTLTEPSHVSFQSYQLFCSRLLTSAPAIVLSIIPRGSVRTATP